jgi:hypothetical protein
MPFITFRDCPGKKYKCSIRLIRICKDNRIRRLSDLTGMTFRELLELPECGKTTAGVVRRILHDNGLDFCLRKARATESPKSLGPGNKTTVTVIPDRGKHKSIRTQRGRSGRPVQRI